MDSIDLSALEHSARRRYEWGRLRDALWGIAPLAWIVGLSYALSPQSASTALAGALALGCGAFVLWYGQGLQRAFVAGVGAGIVPLACALCASRLGHFCAGDRCMTLCVPACAVGGMFAGFAVARVSAHRPQRLSFWLVASGLALLTGALGCACVGFSGVLGLTLGFGAGLFPDAARAALALRSR